MVVGAGAVVVGRPEAEVPATDGVPDGITGSDTVGVALPATACVLLARYGAPDQTRLLARRETGEAEPEPGERAEGGALREPHE